MSNLGAVSEEMMVTGTRHSDLRWGFRGQAESRQHVCVSGCFELFLASWSSNRNKAAEQYDVQREGEAWRGESQPLPSPVENMLHVAQMRHDSCLGSVILPPAVRSNVKNKRLNVGRNRNFHDG